MKNKIVLISTIFIISMIFFTCKHIDTAAQAAAEAELVDRGTANFISISARAFGAAAENVTPEQEYYIGRAVAANILSTYRLWGGDPNLVSYLNLICAAIVINSPNPSLFNGYQVAILDSNEVNAFATSAGHIFVTRGLINVTKTEDDLASVIAHEVAHIQLRHGINSIKSSRMTEALFITATAGIGNAMGMDVTELSDVFGESVGEIIQTMVGSGYSREQEYEADIAAMYLLASAGYHPSALINMLNELNTVHTSGSGFNKTHPAPRSRIYFAQRAVNRFDVADNRLERQQRFNDALNHGVAQR
ncbi:MAG: M48 family metalloprotease [Treponema sp.]|nr:M48 family metalloprotease [Treponema sp.]MCL2237438.1 M48 family metalloprotease [Treponema sp.]